MSHCGTFSDANYSLRQRTWRVTARACRERAARYALDDGEQAWLEQAGRRPLLGREEEAWLATRAQQGCHASRTRMVESNLRLVVSIAKRYRNSGVPFSDLVQEGNVGLIQAVERFDAELGCRFSTFAVCWVRQSILRALSEQSRLVRLPENVVGLLRQKAHAHDRLQARLGREPTLEELATVLGLSEERVAHLGELGRRTFSIDQPCSESGKASWADQYPDPSSGCAFELALDAVTRRALEREMKRLSEREVSVLQLRFGLCDGATWTLDRIAQSMGLTRERVRQIESAALHKLRRHGLRSQVC